MTVRRGSLFRAPGLVPMKKAPRFLIAALVGLMALPLASGASPNPGAVNPSSDSADAAKNAHVDSNSANVQLQRDHLAT